MKSPTPTKVFFLHIKAISHYFFKFASKSKNLYINTKYKIIKK
jgi:hypothetical protein